MQLPSSQVILPHPSRSRTNSNKTLSAALAPSSYPASLRRGFGTAPARNTEAGGPTTPDARSTKSSLARQHKPRTKKVDRQFTKTTVIKEWRDGGEKPEKETWKAQKAALKAKFPEGWNPRKRLSPDALAGIRALHQQFPEEYSTEVLSQKFEVSPEAIRRILRSKWSPSPEEEIERQDRWFNRGKKVWSRWAALGKKPPQKWRNEGIVRNRVWKNEDADKEEEEGPLSRASAQEKLSRTLL